MWISASNKKFFLNLTLLLAAFLLLSGLNDVTLASAARKSKAKAKTPIVKIKKAKKATSKSTKKLAPKTSSSVVQRKQATSAPTILEGIWKTQESLYDFNESTGEYRQTEQEKGFIEFKGNRYCPFLQFDDKGLFSCAQYHFFALNENKINITYQDAPDLQTDGTWQINVDKLELVLNNNTGTSVIKSKRIFTRPQLASSDKLKMLNGVWKATQAFILDDTTGQYKEEPNDGLDIYFSFIGYRFCDAYLEDGRLRCGGYGTWTLVGDSIKSVATGQDAGLKIKGNALEYFGGGKGVVFKYILQKTNLTPPSLASSSVVQE